jgi:Gluconate 2-dehydrogenase subunit 3
MERRAVLKLVALTAFSPNMTLKMDALQGSAACHMGSASATSSNPEYKLQFFSEDESRVLDQLMEMIIPADSQSPGAHATKTHLFADVMVATSDDADKKQWQDGICLIREEAARSSLAEALRKASNNEGNPQTDLEQFFAVLKEMTVRGYYTSAIAIEQDLRYVGNTYLPVFPECTHPEHTHPENQE